VFERLELGGLEVMLDERRRSSAPAAPLPGSGEVRVDEGGDGLAAGVLARESADRDDESVGLGGQRRYPVHHDV